MVLFIIGILLFLGGLGFAIYTSIKTVKNTLMKPNYKDLFTRLGIALGVTVLGGLTALCGIHLWVDQSASTFQWLFTLLVGPLFIISLFALINSFILHYYGKTFDKKIDKILFIILMVCLPLTFISFLYTTNGYASYLTYPLYKAFNFSHGFVGGNESNPDGLTITFYALCILTGAISVYFLCDHKMYLQYGKHGIMESTFLVAFPAGIVGARIFYVLGELDSFIEKGFWQHAFNFTEGGLTILGGAVTGIVVGVLWFKWRHKDLNIWLTVDICVPTILLAQAAGRWGNFFNLEVFGAPVNESYFSFLPNIITSNLHYPASTYFDGNLIYQLKEGEIWLPLFIIEGTINIFGYCLLAHVFGNRFRKYTELGDLAFGYIVWYGLTRVLLEPLRVREYQMGTWSWYWSFAFVIVGVLLIGLNHIIKMHQRNKKGELVIRNYYLKGGLISSIVLSSLGIILLGIGLGLMLTNEMVIQVAFDGFNTGLMFTMLGLGLIGALSISLPYFIYGKRKQL